MLQLRRHVMFEYVYMEILWVFLWDFAISFPKELIRYIYDYFCLLQCQEEHNTINGALVARRFFASKLKYKIHGCLLCGGIQYENCAVPWKINRSYEFSLSPGEINHYLAWLDDVVWKYSGINCFRFDDKVLEKHKLYKILSIYGNQLNSNCFEEPLFSYFRGDKDTLFEKGMKRKRRSLNERGWKRRRIQ